MRASCAQRACNGERAPSGVFSAPVLSSEATVESGAEKKRPFAQWPCGHNTAGRKPEALSVGTYRFPVTRCPGKLSKTTLSTRYPSRTAPGRMVAFSGVLAGYGYKPQAIWT